MVHYDHSQAELLLSSVSCWCSHCRRGKFFECENFTNEVRSKLPLNSLLKMKIVPKSPDSTIGCTVPLSIETESITDAQEMPSNVLSEIFSDNSAFDEADIVGDSPSLSIENDHLNDIESEFKIRLDSVTLSAKDVSEAHKKIDSHFLQKSLSAQCDTFGVEDIVTIIRPLLMARKVLILNSHDISELALICEQNNFQSSVSQSKLKESIESKLNAFSSGRIREIERIDCILYSSTTMAIRDSLVHEMRPSTSAHFVFASLCLKTGVVKVYDTLGLSSISECTYFSEKSIRGLFKRLVVTLTTRRSVRFNYLNTHYRQEGNSCGYLSLFHSILALKTGSLDILQKFSFENFESSLYSVKDFLVAILLSGTIPLEKIQISPSFSL